ncbi:hypothetical protein CEXT_769291 [Caerostris extrusa]|uniref:Uncharacterized protein n=1 Tax=Caerostris extrusa TaxID=172846 RepID=A0AAV4V211_CAEEX|nr:hypothetical protein CEXT_769291 [Caerostris extrusa]
MFKPTGDKEKVSGDDGGMVPKLDCVTCAIRMIQAIKGPSDMRVMSKPTRDKEKVSGGSKGWGSGMVPKLDCVTCTIRKIQGIKGPSGKCGSFGWITRSRMERRLFPDFPFQTIEECLSQPEIRRKFQGFQN